MDIDRFLAANGPAWDRLEALVTHSGRGVGRLDAAELDELVRLYQRVSGHLSYARTYFTDAALIARLTTLVGRANAVVYGVTPALGAVGGPVFFTTTFPTEIWALRGYIAVAAALFVVPGAVVAVWMAHSARALDASAPAALRQAYVSHDFAAYYRSQPSAQFAAQVQTNNIRVAFEVFAFGIAGCVLSAVVLAQNGIGVGQAAGLFTAAGKQPQFWGLILPHGLLETTSIVIAGAAGLRLGWALIVPGDQSRSRAVAAEGRRSIAVVAGLILTFIVAGTIEGFVTGSALPTAARLGIGITVEVAFFLYVVTLGRRPATTRAAKSSGGATTTAQSAPVALASK